MKKLLLLPLLLIATPAFASGPTYSGQANYFHGLGGEVYCAGGNTSCTTFMSDALTYLTSHPASTITVVATGQSCYSVTEATYSGPSGDGGLIIDGFTSCSGNPTGVASTLTINDPPPPPSPSMQGSIIALPSATSTLLTASAGAIPLSQGMLPIALLVAGIIIGGSVLVYFVGSMKKTSRSALSSRGEVRYFRKHQGYYFQTGGRFTKHKSTRSKFYK